MEAALTIGLWTGFFWRVNKSIDKRVKRKNLVMKGKMHKCFYEKTWESDQMSTYFVKL